MLQRKSGAVLELLLAGGSYRSTLGLTMIGAMPAVAVRHERRKQERRHKRPSQLGIASPPGAAADSLDGVCSPELLQSPPHRSQLGRQEYYVCGKVSVLHVVVVSLLLGAILVIVGLVQLTPGADASQHRYLLLGAGGALLVTGILLAVLRCCVLPWRERRQPGAPAHASAAAPAPPASAASQGSVGGASGASGAEAGGSGSGSVRDGGTRSRTNSTTNGQPGRRASAAFGVCTPTGAQRRRSLMEVERGLPADDGPAMTPSARAEVQNHLNEMSAAAPGELAATIPATASPPPSATLRHGDT